jgi:hypothetical protein
MFIFSYVLGAAFVVYQTKIEADNAIQGLNNKMLEGVFVDTFCYYLFKTVKFSFASEICGTKENAD